MDFVSITQCLINVLKCLPFDEKRKVALEVLEKFLKHANGEKVSEPTIEEWKITTDVIKELKQNNASSWQEYNIIENQAENIKNLIDQLYYFTKNARGQK